MQSDLGNVLKMLTAEYILIDNVSIQDSAIFIHLWKGKEFDMLADRFSEVHLSVKEDTWCIEKHVELAPNVYAVFTVVKDRPEEVNA